MRLSRTDLLPVLAIIGGGAVGVLTFSPLGLWSHSHDVPAPVRVVVPPATAQPETRVPPEAPRWYWRLDESTGKPFLYEVPRSSEPDLEEGTEPLIYIDGVRMSSERSVASILKGQNPDLIDRIHAEEGVRDEMCDLQ